MFRLQPVRLPVVLSPIPSVFAPESPPRFSSSRRRRCCCFPIPPDEARSARAGSPICFSSFARCRRLRSLALFFAMDVDGAAVRDDDDEWRA